MARPSSVALEVGALVEGPPKLRVTIASAAVVALVVLGAILRLPFLTPGLWRDEGSTYAVVSAPTLGGVIANLQYNEQTPPLYYVMEHLWIGLAGTSEVALRLPSFVCIVAAIALMYALGAYVGSRFTGTIAATIAAIAPLSLTVAMEARAYGPVILLAGITLYAFARSSDATEHNASVKWSLGLIVAMTALVATHFTGFVVFAALMIVAVVQAKVRRSEASLRTFASLAVAGVLALPFLFSMLQHLRTFASMADGQNGTTISRIADHLNAFSPFGAMQAQIDLALEIGTLVWLASIVVRRRLDRQDRWGLVMLLIVVFGIVASFKMQMAPERHLSAYEPAAWTFVALLLDRFVRWLLQPAKRWELPLRVVTALAILYIGVGGLAEYPRMYRGLLGPISGGEALAASLDSLHIQEPIELVAIPDSVGPTLFYYLRGTSGVALRGVGSWENPQFYSIEPDYWLRPGFERAQLALIDGYAGAHHAAIVLAVDRNTIHFNDMPAGRGKQITDALERAYGVRYERSFPGRREPLDLIVLGNPR